MTQAPSHPLVSVVVPAYNQARFLREALESVVAQSYAHWEAIVVNNHSDDDTVEVTASLNDSRISLVNFRNDGIIAASRNKGIALSSGSYIAFLDSDDKWYPDKLERCVAILETPKDLVCHGEHFLWDGGRRKTVTYGPARRATYRELLYRRNCLSTSAVVVRREALLRAGGFDENPSFVTAEDYDLWLRLAREGCVFGFTDEVLGEYRMHSANATKAADRYLAGVSAVLKSHFDRQDDHSFRERLRRRRRIMREYLGVANGMVRRGEPVAALRPLFSSFRALVPGGL
jgi:glycosyltransferase involved in cell wall biosynthesis